MKVYALELKQESTAGVSVGILRNFRTATFENNFRGLLLKRKQRRRRMRSDPCGFNFSLFQGIYLFSHETRFFFQNFSHSGAFQLGFCYPFLYTKERAWQSSFYHQDFSGKKYFIAIRQTIKVLRGDLPRVNECATMPSVNNVTKST